jgi:hydrogenase maturation protein HypF
MSNLPAERLRVVLRGVVQGVGFRPHVHRIATALGLRGFVRNTPQGVVVEVEGARARLDEFLLRLDADKPPRASIQSLEPSWLQPARFGEFEILDSAQGGDTTAFVPPDIAVCPDCLRELLNPLDRRHLYPFTNCTNCGPRHSIIEALPYDRANTSMRAFPMCAACSAEYWNPADRRFHAQPNACPACGPRIAFHGGPAGEPTARDGEALEEAACTVEHGSILALQGIGGFLLVCDARSEDAVRRLRQRKHREEKPFAVMFPSVGAVAACCSLSQLEERALRGPEAPIVLLERRDAGGIAPSVAPSNPCLGAMLPYAPLHHLLMRRLGFPVVATSGNLSDEPICTTADEAFDRLSSIADAYLVHDRPIVRPVDDSVVRVAAGREMVLRRARGYAPLPLPAPRDLPPVIALGAHLKNTISLAAGREIFVSQHLGDLDTAASTLAFLGAVADFLRLFGRTPVAVACDMHPDYRSTLHARSMGLPVVPVQHHHAHMAACIAENEIDGEVLGVSWDGTGYGLDQTVWGGEFLAGTATRFRRAAHLRPFRLPGGERAVREPRRSAIGALFEVFGSAAFEMRDLPCFEGFSDNEVATLRRSLERGINAPVTTSAGRLFDAVASLAGARQVMAFEGQAAMMLEYAAAGARDRGVYPFTIREGTIPAIVSRWDAGNLAGGGGAGEGPLLVVDWAPLLEAVVADRRRGEAVDTIAARFHSTVAAAIVAVAVRCGLDRVALSGGCFQNRLLLEGAVGGLRQAGLSPFWHQRIPPNDGGISPGQAFVAASILAEES